MSLMTSAQHMRRIPACFHPDHLPFPKESTTGKPSTIEIIRNIAFQATSQGFFTVGHRHGGKINGRLLYRD
jgi:hypothetical protein